MELYMVFSAFTLLIGVGGIVYGAGAKLATKKEVAELEKRIDARIIEHEKQNREDMKEIRDMFNTIRLKIDTGQQRE